MSLFLNSDNNMNYLASSLCFPDAFSDAPPPPPPPVVYFRGIDDALRDKIKTLRERQETLKEKAIDPYATSPEITPPVSKYGHAQSNMQTENKLTNTASAPPNSPSPSWSAQHLF